MDGVLLIDCVDQTDGIFVRPMRNLARCTKHLRMLQELNAKLSNTSYFYNLKFKTISPNAFNMQFWTANTVTNQTKQLTR